MMTVEDACIKIQNFIHEKNKYTGSWYSLDLTSQSEQQEDGSFKEMYRADCLYMVTGSFESTISKALISLAERI